MFIGAIAIWALEGGGKKLRGITYKDQCQMLNEFHGVLKLIFMLIPARLIAAWFALGWVFIGGIFYFSILNQLK